MTAFFRRRVLLLILLAVAALPAFAVPSERQILGPHRSYHTPTYVLRGDAPGPVVLIQAGIHGDELAGTFALDAMIKKMAIRNGTVIFIPRLNALAVAREQRYVHYDLNRAFGSPQRSRPYEFSLARDLEAFARGQKIDYMVTLHEAHWLYDTAMPRSLGQTICYGVNPPPPLLDAWLSRLNSNVVLAPDKFNAKYFPIATSSTEVMTADLHLKGGFCVETWRELPLDRRIAYQRAAVESFLVTAGIDFRYNEPPSQP